MALTPLLLLLLRVRENSRKEKLQQAPQLLQVVLERCPSQHEAEPRWRCQLAQPHCALRRAVLEHVRLVHDDAGEGEAAEKPPVVLLRRAAGKTRDGVPLQNGFKSSGPSRTLLQEAPLRIEDHEEFRQGRRLLSSEWCGRSALVSLKQGAARVPDIKQCVASALLPVLLLRRCLLLLLPAEGSALQAPKP